MSIIRSSQYPNRWNVPDANSLQGSGKNRTSPTSNDGSYFDEVWFNDMDSLHQALFIASGVSPDGTQDVGTASQIFDALINKKWSAIGNYEKGVITLGSDGNEYYCNTPNGRDLSVTNPVGDLTGAWRKYPFESVVSGGVTYEKWFDGTLKAYGKQTIPNGSLTAVINFSVNFTAAPVFTYGFDLAGGISFVSYSFLTGSSVTLNKVGDSSGTYEVSFNANGRWA